MNTVSKMRLTGVLLSLLLTACGGAGGGGGSGGGSGPVNTAPIARAGTDQSVLAGSLVSLDGSASSDAESDPLTYTWTLVTRPADSVAVLSAANASRPQ